MFFIPYMSLGRFLKPHENHNHICLIHHSTTTDRAYGTQYVLNIYGQMQGKKKKKEMREEEKKKESPVTGLTLDRKQ